LRSAEALVQENRMVEQIGLSLPAEQRPLLHYAERLDVLAWTLEPAEDQ
jgi:hypothetical protein